VLLEPDGHAWLADFGVARAVAATTNTGSGDVVGTPAYLAPEVFCGGPATPAADRYALACLAFECLTGSPPFTAERVEGLLYAHVHRRPPRATALRPELPRGLDAVLARGLAKDPARRPETGAALAGALSDAVAPRRTLARPRSALAAVGAGLVLLGVAAGGLVVNAARSGGGGGEPASAAAPSPPTLTVPGPTGAALPAVRASAADLPGLPAGVRAGVAEVGGVRVAAVPETAGLGSDEALARARAALEEGGYSAAAIEVDGTPVGTAEIQPLDTLIGMGPRWALMDLRAAGGDLAVIARGAPDDVERYAAALARARPGALRAP
jgi:Protein kinase domain